MVHFQLLFHSRLPCALLVVERGVSGFIRAAAPNDTIVLHSVLHTTFIRTCLMNSRMYWAFYWENMFDKKMKTRAGLEAGNFWRFLPATLYTGTGRRKIIWFDFVFQCNQLSANMKFHAENLTIYYLSKMHFISLWNNN